MMNTNLLQAMGRIDPKLIADAAPDVEQKKSTNKRWIKWASLAACLCIMITTVVVAIPYISRDGNRDDVQNPAKSYLQLINGFWYEPLSNPEFLFEQYPELEQITNGGIYLITEDDLGEYIGVVPAYELENLSEGKAYHWIKYPELDSIIIVERNGKYNVYIANTNVPFDDYKNSSAILNKFNLPALAVSMEVLNTNTFIGDGLKIEEFCSIIANKECDLEYTYQDLIWQAWLSEKGEVGVNYDGNEFSYDNAEIRDEFADYYGANIVTIVLNTKNGFEITMYFDTEFNYINICGRVYNLTDEETGRICTLLDIIE